KIAESDAPPPVNLDDEWGLDYMEDRLWNRRKIRSMTLEDRLSREGLALEIDFSLTGRRVTRILDQVASDRGCYPGRVRVDTGPENWSRAMIEWSVKHDVETPLHRSWQARTKRLDRIF